MDADRTLRDNPEDEADQRELSSQEALNRWRLVLGPSAEEGMRASACYDAESFAYAEMDELLDFLYSREYGAEQGYREKGGGQGNALLTVPKWLNRVRRLFPKETSDILEKEALERYNLTEMLTDKKVLESLKPNMTLLKSILQFKGRMKGEVLKSAKAIVRQVVEDLQKRLASQTQAALRGKRTRRTSLTERSYRNLNMKKTIARNLKNYDKESGRLPIDRFIFDSRQETYNQWEIIIAVDESGSMLDSVIYSAVMAGIFYGLQSIRTRLLIFDTQVVDLSDRLDDPVDVLMSVQLGGGTHIAKAVRYGESLMENPSRTLFILVSDLEEGYGLTPMYRACQDVMDAGAKLLVLTALDFAGEPVYNRAAAQQLSNKGANVAAITPLQLADWVADAVSR